LTHVPPGFIDAATIDQPLPDGRSVMRNQTEFREIADILEISLDEVKVR
jgi:hypothetical protein